MFSAIIVAANGDPLQMLVHPSWHTGDDVCQYFGIEGTNKYAAAGAGFLATSGKWLGFKILIRPSETAPEDDEVEPFSLARTAGGLVDTLSSEAAFAKLGPYPNGECSLAELEGDKRRARQISGSDDRWVHNGE